MQRVYSNPDSGVAHLVCNVLAQHGIDAVVRGERRAALVGQSGWTETWAEVWVGDPGRIGEAQALVAETTAGPDARPSWRCPSCGEDIDGVFGACWSCGAEQPA